MARGAIHAPRQTVSITVDPNASSSPLPRIFDSSSTLSGVGTVTTASALTTVTSYSLSTYTSSGASYIQASPVVIIVSNPAQSSSLFATHTTSSATPTAIAGTSGSGTAGAVASTSGVASVVASGSSTSAAAKIGIGVAVPVGVILIAVILASFLIHRRRRMRREQRQNKGSRPDDGHAGEIPEGQEHFETYYKKPELEAEPVIDHTVSGPVKTKFELQSQGIMKAKAVGDPRATDAVEAPNTNRRWSHEPGGYMPPELHPNPISEAGTGTLTELQMKPLKQQAGVSKTSTSTSTAVPSSSDQSPLQPFQTISAESSELAEEADVIVQELGLVKLRKKALATQASAMRKKPEDVEGRRGEEFKELLGREARLKGRLDEIERQRQGQGGLT